MKENHQEFGPDLKQRNKTRPKAGFFCMNWTDSILISQHVNWALETEPAKN